MAFFAACLRSDFTALWATFRSTRYRLGILILVLPLSQRLRFRGLSCPVASTMMRWAVSATSGRSFFLAILEI